MSSRLTAAAGEKVDSEVDDDHEGANGSA